jgi:hypothetical protein
VLVTLSNGSVITIGSGASSGTVSVAARTDDSYDQGTTTVTASISSATGGNFETLTVSGGAASTTVVDDEDATSVSLAATGGGTEGQSITYTATLGAAAQADTFVTLSNGSVITIGSGASSGTVSVAARTDDSYDQGTTTVTASISSATGGNFETLTVSGGAASTTVVDDEDATSVSLAATGGGTEGQSITYTATLGAAAQADTFVTLSNGSVITIGSGASSGTVSVAARTDDSYDQGTTTVTASISSATGGNFETLTVSGGAASTTVVDDEDATSVSLAATGGGTEGQSITYTATLGAAAQADTFVTLSNGSVITIGSGASSGTVSVAARTDDSYDQGTTTVTASISSATGGNFETLTVSGGAASTTVVDDEDATSVSLAATGGGTEGQSITYTATLGAAAQADTFVTLSNGSVITIGSGASSGTVSVAARTDDSYDQGTTTVTASISSATGGNFETLTVSGGAASTTVVDDEDATSVSLAATGGGTEGQSITYTATLGAAAQADTFVTLSNGSVITIGSGASSGTVSVAARTDDSYDQGTTTVTASISSATGGNFETLTVSGGAASTTVVDDEDATSVSLAATGGGTEGQSITYTATLGAAAQADTFVTLSNGSVITIGSGASSGTVSVAARTDDSYDQGTTTVTASISSATGGNFETLTVSGGAASTTVVDDEDATSVSLAATGGGTEGQSITYTATLGAAAQADTFVTLSNGSVITIGSGASSGTVSVAARTDDSYDQGTTTVTASISSATGGNFETLTVSGGAASTTVVDDEDATSVSLAATGGGTEGQSITYTATLGAAAQADTFVTLSNGSVITIGSGASSGTVSVAARTDDSYDQGTTTVTASISSATGGNFETLTVSGGAASTTVVDDEDATSVSLAATGGGTEGQSITYTATLGAAAQADTFVTLSNGSVITIGSGASSGTVSVAARTDDSYDQGTTTVTASISSATGGNFETLTVSGGAASTTVVDDEDATSVSLAATGGGTEGQSITYTATLGAAAQADTFVTLSNGSVITIGSGASSGTVSVAARTDDSYDQGTTTVTASISSATGGNFETLTVSGGAASTTVVDDEDATSVSLAATGGGTEGQSITYTATLGAAAQADTFVTLSNGSVITIGSGASSGTVSVAARTDDSYDQGTTTVTASISSATGGNFETLTVSGGAASTTVVDDEDATSVSLAATGGGTEGQSITYTATLGAAAQADTFVTLSNGSVITIGSGASSGTVSVAARTDDSYDQGTTTVTASISSATGGNFETLTVSGGAASTTVVDDEDATSVSLAATGGGTEGQSITYTATLGAAAQADTFVTLSNGSVITIGSGASSGTVSVAARTDDSYDQGTTTVTASISSATGGNFETLTVSGGAASTTVVDDEDATSVSLAATGGGTEGQSITYTATLGAAAQADTFVTLSNGSVITIGSGASSGTVSVAARTDDSYDQGTTTVTASISSATGGNFETLTVSGGAASTTVVDDEDATSVSLAATGGGTEGQSITYTATLGAAAQADTFVTLSNGSVITIGSGASSGTVSVAARTDDSYDQGTTTVTASISSATGGNFETLTVSGGAASTTVVDDEDATSVSLAATGGGTEGQSITYTATLGAAAQADTFVTLSNGSVITIGSGASSGTVSVAARTDDSYDQGTTTVTASISSATGGNFETLTVSGGAASTTVVDDEDATSVSLAATGGGTEGQSITYTATLGAAAQADTFVTLSNGSVITIGSGASSGTVSVAARTDDSYDQGTTTVTASISSATGGNFETLTVSGGAASTTVVDDEDATSVSLAATGGGTEGQSITYTATLGAAAQADTFVTLSNGSVITIGSGASSGTVSVAARTDDSYDQGTTTVTASISSATGGNFETLTVSGGAASTTVVDDEDATSVSLAATGGGTEGQSITYTATLGAAAQADTFVTLSNGSVITIGSGASSGTVSVAARTDDSYDQGTTTVTASISSATGGNFETLTVSGGAASTTVVDDEDATSVSLTGGPGATVVEGSTATGYVLTLGNTPVSDVTVTLSYGGTASDGSDFTGVTTVTIPSGSTTASFSIATTNDTTLEGAENFTVTVVGASGGGLEAFTPHPTNNSVTTTIGASDSPPSATDVSNTGNEDPLTPIAITLTGTDTDAGGSIASVTISTLPVEGRLYYDAAKTLMVGLGDVISGSSATLYYQPLAEWSGNATFTYTVTDNEGLTDPTPATATITVNPVDDGTSVANNDSITLPTGATYFISLATLLGNDTLYDGATITAQTNPGSGTLTPVYSGSVLTGYDYTPAGAGTTSFTYTITDTQLTTQTSTATVTLNVVAAADDFATVDESALSSGNGGGSTTASGNLFNGSESVSAITNIVYNSTTYTPSGGIITISTGTGTLVVTAATGAYTYTLTSAATNGLPGSGTDTAVIQDFTYTKADATSATLHITIEDDKPTATNFTVEVPESVLPKYTLVLVVDTSGSMSDEVQSIASDGTVTLTTRMDMAKEALISLISEYYSQTADVQVKLISFEATGTALNGGLAYDNKEDAIADVNALVASGGTNYEDGLTLARGRDGGWLRFKPPEHRLFHLGRQPDVGQHHQPGDSRSSGIPCLHNRQWHPLLWRRHRHRHYRCQPPERDPQRGYGRQWRRGRRDHRSRPQQAGRGIALYGANGLRRQRGGGQWCTERDLRCRWRLHPVDHAGSRYGWQRQHGHGSYLHLQPQRRRKHQSQQRILALQRVSRLPATC